jgi:hypothetical protein
MSTLTCPTWSELTGELDRWADAGLEASLWWRDDDAVTPTERLDRLLELAGGAPLALAVIPAEARRPLAAWLDLYPRVSVLHHGWSHRNRAAPGKKSEYPAERHPVEVADELDEGRRHLRALFGARAAAVFVPPWNRFAERFAPLLAEAGFAAISQIAPRRWWPASGLGVLDVHVDVVDWRGGRGFIGTDVALALLVGELRARRRGFADAAAPIGLLTHHLVMDGATEDFLGRLGEVVALHPAARWAGMSELVPAR